MRDGRGGGTYHHESGCRDRGTEVHVVFVEQGQIEVSAREATEGADQGEEDDEEDDVGAERADQEDEA